MEGEIILFPITGRISRDPELAFRDQISELFSAQPVNGGGSGLVAEERPGRRILRWFNRRFDLRYFYRRETGFEFSLSGINRFSGFAGQLSSLSGSFQYQNYYGDSGSFSKRIHLLSAADTIRFSAALAIGMVGSGLARYLADRAGGSPLAMADRKAVTLIQIE